MGSDRVSPSIDLPPPGKISADRPHSQVNRDQILFGAGALHKKRENRGRARAAAALCLEEQLPGGSLCGPEAIDRERLLSLQTSSNCDRFVLGGRPCHSKGRRERQRFLEYLSRLSLGGALPCGPEAVDCERFFSKYLFAPSQIISQVLGTRGRSGIQKSTLIFPGGWPQPPGQNRWPRNFWGWLSRILDGF